MLRTTLDVFGLAAAIVLLIAALRMLGGCRRAELSFNSVTALGLGACSALAIGRSIGPTPMEIGHVLLLMVAASWAVRSLLRAHSRGKNVQR